MPKPLTGKTKKMVQNESRRPVFWVFVCFIFLSLYGSIFLITNNDTVESATPPPIISYQGKLLQSGAAVSTNQSFGFLLFDAATNGNLLYTAGGTLASTSTVSITPTSGIFSVDLGDGSLTNSIPTSTFQNNHTVYLEVHVGDTTLTPRKRLYSAPFAINSEYLMGLSATSTSGTEYIPHANEFGNFVFGGNARGSTVGDGLIYLNPSSTVANATVFGIGVAGNERFRVDEDGDVFTSGGILTTASSTFTANLHIGGVLNASSTLIATSSVYFGSLLNCDTIDTDGDGLLTCGTDGGGGAGESWSLVNNALKPTTTVGFIAPASSSIASSLNVVGNLNASSTLFINGTIEVPAATDLILQTATFRNALVIDDSAGRVGIGTTTPWAHLAVTTTAGTNAFVIGSSTATYFIVDEDGRVGIGTTDPASALEVAGNADFQSSVTLGSDNTFTILAQGDFISGLRPDTNNDYDLGAYGNAWRSLYSSTTLFVGGAGTQVTLDNNSLDSEGALTIQTTGAQDITLQGATFRNALFMDDSTSRLGIGTTTPYATLSVSTTGGTPSFVIGSSTKTHFIVDENGSVGIGTDSLSGVGGLEIVNLTGGSGINNAPNYLQITGATANNNNYPVLALKAGTLANNYPNLQLSNGGLEIYLQSGDHSTNYNNQMDIGLGAQASAVASFVRFRREGSEIARLTGDGNWGFNSTAPDRALEINTSTGNALRLTYNDSDGGATNYADFLIASDGALTIESAGTDEDITIQGGTFRNALFMDDSTSRLGIGTTTPYATLSVSTTGGTPGFVIGSSTATYLIVDENGNLGIGTDVPSAIADVLGITEQLRLSYDSSDYASFTVASDGALTINASGSDEDIIIQSDLTANAIFLDSSADNVGIGTTGPGAAFDINDASGANLRLTYNDANGSAANYADFTMASDGALQINTEGTDADIEIRTENSDNVIYIDDSADRIIMFGTSGSGELQINDGGDAGGHASIYLNATSNGQSGLFLSEDSDIQAAVYYDEQQNSFYIRNYEATTNYSILQVADAGTLELRGQFFDNAIYLNDTTHRIGIGTTTPFGLFSVSSTGAANAFVVGNTDGTHMIIDSAGEVGIGTEAPDRALEINSAAGNNLRLSFADTNGSAANYADFRTTANGSLNIFSVGSTTLETTLFKNALSIDNTNSRIGIGTTTPYATLSVSTTGGTPGFVIGSSTATYLIVDENGNLGLNVTDPDASAGLHIASRGLLSTVSSTFTANLHIGGVLNASSTLIATSSVYFGSLLNCDTIDTDGDGLLTCGTDGGGGAGESWSLVNNALKPTTTVGFIAPASSSIASSLNVTGNLNASSTLFVNSTIEVPAATDLILQAATFRNALYIDDSTSRIGIGTTTPYATLSVSTTGGTPAFAIGSSTQTYLIVDDEGKLGLGTTTPWATLSISTTEGTPAFVIGSSTTHFLVNDDGHVIIGSDVGDPGMIVSIMSQGSNAADLTLGAVDSGNAAIHLDASNGDTSGGDYLSIYQDDNLDGFITLGASGGTNDLNIHTGGDFTMVIREDETVGIGTTVPGRELDINHQDGGGLRLTFNDSNGGATTYVDFVVLGDGALEIDTAGSDADITMATPGYPLAFKIDNNNDTIGIGTTGAEAALDINDTTGDLLQLTYNDSNGSATTYTTFNMASDGALTIETAGSDEDITIQGGTFRDAIFIDDSTSRVGIGTSTPFATLSVSTTGGTIPFVIGSSTASLFIVHDTGQVKIGDDDPALVTNNTLTVARNGNTLHNISMSNDATGHTASDGFQIQQQGDSEILIVQRENAYIAWHTNNAERMRLEPDGQLGLNTTAPDATLDINSSTGGALRLTYNDSDGAATEYAHFSIASDGALSITTAGSDEDITIQGGTFSNALFMDDSTSRIGIGTTTPYATLSVSTTGGTPSFVIGSSTKTHFVVNENGYVGIGTDAPRSFLDITSGNSGDATLYISADLDDNNEADNPSIRLEQDGNNAHAIFALEGESGTISPDTLLNSLVIGSEDGDPAIQFLTTDIVRMTIEPGGDIGIGTNNPDVALEINDSTGGNLRLTYNDSNGSATNYADFTLASDGALTIESAGTDEDITIQGGTFRNALFMDDSTSRIGIGTTTPYATLSVSTTGGTPSFVIGSSTATHVIVDENGFVGIGTDNPSSTIHIARGGGGVLDYDLIKLGSTVADKSSVKTRLGYADGAGTDRSAWRTFNYNEETNAKDATGYGALRILTLIDSQAGRNSGEGIYFQRMAPLETAWTSALFIDQNNGSIGIATTSPWGMLAVSTTDDNVPSFVVSSTVDVFLVDAEGQVIIGNGSNNLGGAGSLLVTNGVHITADDDTYLISDASNGAGSATLYIGNETIDTTASDIRLKENVISTEIDALEVVSRFNIVDFDWKAGTKRAGRGRATGLIAQDVFEYLPQVVNKPTNPDNTWAVEYQHIVPYLIKGIQDQQAQIQVLASGNLQGNLSANLNTENLIVKDATFTGNITVRGHAIFDKDTVGQARIVVGDKEVRVRFVEEYKQQPVITVTPRGEAALLEFKHTVVKESTTGFTIKLDREAPANIEFSWHAFGSDNGRITVSDGSSEGIKIVVGEPDWSSNDGLQTSDETDDGQQTTDDSQPVTEDGSQTTEDQNEITDETDDGQQTTDDNQPPSEDQPDASPSTTDPLPALAGDGDSDTADST